ncbi:unnamed protein product [Paramecium pentaurelia]|uniref:Thioredoxin domain-containing protein n=1 Tax=Paramecium pentaurelia TaxID=43138 RepID=A0A8S1RWI4_9CILI|nr:unnamed protein product [Paramecium pentaurelia]
MLNIIICVVLAYSQTTNSQQHLNQIHNNNTDLQIFEILIVAPNNNSLIIVENPHILITFYQKECPYSAQFIEYELNKLQEDGNKFNVTFGLYDVAKTEFHTHQSMNKFGIVETPTIIFFQNEVPHVFSGKKKSHIVSKWIQEFFNGNPPPKEIFTESEFNQLLEDNKNVLFYQKNSTSTFDINFDKFYQFAIQNTIPEIVFAFSSQYQKNNLFSLKYYKQETKEEFTFNYQFNLEYIKKFVLKYSLPLIPQLNSKTEELVFQSNSFSFILFYGLDEISKQAELAFQEVAKTFNNSYQFSKLNIQDENYLEYIIDLGVNDGIIPKIVTINGQFKYKYDGPDFSVTGIKSLIFKLKQGQIDSYILSEPIPDYTHKNSYVKKIVGLNYDDEIKKSNKNILLKYHVKNCELCVELESIYEQLAYNYREDKSLVIAEIDIRLNDFTDAYYPRQTPDIILFLQKNGKRQAIFWNFEEMTLDLIQIFVENNIHQVNQ